MAAHCSMKTGSGANVTVAGLRELGQMPAPLPRASQVSCSDVAAV